MSLTLIIGPMFSGKTTELLRIVERAEAIGRTTLVINHSIDVRYTDSSSISTHTKRTHECIPLDSMTKLFNDEYHDILHRASLIAINEGQFFTDLYPSVMKLIEYHHKDVVVCGLDSDYLRKPFLPILYLIPMANSVMKLTSLCSECKSGKEAIHSKRVWNPDNLRPEFMSWIHNCFYEKISKDNPWFIPLPQPESKIPSKEYLLSISIYTDYDTKTIQENTMIVSGENVDELLYLLEHMEINKQYHIDFIIKNTSGEYWETRETLQDLICVSNIKVGGIAEYRPVCRECYLRGSASS
jgi:thymidine kinase